MTVAAFGEGRRRLRVLVLLERRAGDVDLFLDHTLSGRAFVCIYKTVANFTVENIVCVLSKCDVGCAHTALLCAAGGRVIGAHVLLCASSARVGDVWN